MKASELGFKDLTFKNQLKIAEALLHKESYIAGHTKPLMTPAIFQRTFTNWLSASRQDPSNAPYVIKSKIGQNKRGYIIKITQQFPTFLHKVYRHATSVVGVSESTCLICRQMEVYAREKYPDCPIRGNLVRKKHNFWKFFYMNGGKLKRPITKPRLTTEQIKESIAFSNKWINKIQDKDLHICFLDEKWFYTTSRRKKMKILPQADFETDKQAFIPKPKL